MFPKFTKPRFQEEFLALTEKVGHHQITLFERQVLPLVNGGRDLAVETPEGENISAALALAALPQTGDREQNSVTVVLTSGPEAVKKIGQLLRLFVSRCDATAYTVAIGMDDNIKKELQLLSKPPDFIVGTPERLIDHIRRENLSIAHVRRVIIDLPDDYEATGFDKDLQFIYSKLSSKVQTLLFASTLAANPPILTILKRPHVLSRQEESEPTLEHIVYKASGEGEKSQLLGDLLYAEEVEDCAVVCRSRSTADRVSAQLSAQGLPAKQLSTGCSADELKRCESELETKAIRAVVTDSLRGALQIKALKRVILYEMPSDASSYSDLKAQMPKLKLCSPLISLVSKDEQGVFEGTQEVQYVDTANNPSNEDILKGKIRSIVKRIKEDEDPDELNRLRKIVRKNVPVFLRGYFMAYLIKETADKRNTDQDMKTLFVSIGKNRRVFPRDLSRLFSGTLEIKAGSIGNIKVLDNYSFIDVPETLAERAISLLDGKDFRGRKITVNHARKKEED